MIGLGVAHAGEIGGLPGEQPALAGQDTSRSEPGTNTSTTSAQQSDGAKLAQIYCVSCHLFPEPTLLDKGTWEREALPFMSKWLGISRMNLDIRPGRRFVETAGVFPTSAIVSTNVWQTICRYYVESAPAAPLPQAPHAPIQKRLRGFEVINPDYRFQVPLTTLVEIDSARRQFFLGDAGIKTLNVLDGSGKMQFSMPLESAPVSVTLKGDVAYVTLIGSVVPSDEPEGKVIRLARTPTGLVREADLAANLTRPAGTVFGDLNNDNREDFAVCGFGNYLGRFSWFENLGGDKYSEHILFDRPGAVRAYAIDLTHDGLLDLVVLMAQAREGIYLFTNKGDGSFNVRPLVEHHPAYGSSFFQLVDFNGDGFLDLLETNGDNGEYASCLKNYHGIRIYLNDGLNNFRESWFFPLNGAYKAMAADFDKDGDLDIAAISFYPDFERTPEEGFVYLENQGGLEFVPSSFPEALSGRWLTMDVNDLDGDGYPDIVLGSFTRGPNEVPTAVSRRWESTGPSFLILKNTSRTRPNGQGFRVIEPH